MLQTIYLQNSTELCADIDVSVVCFSQVHIRVASPPIKYPCYMGINIPTREELVANRMSIDEVRDYIGM